MVTSGDLVARISTRLIDAHAKARRTVVFIPGEVEIDCTLACTSRNWSWFVPRCDIGEQSCHDGSQGALLYVGCPPRHRR